MPKNIVQVTQVTEDNNIIIVEKTYDDSDYNNSMTIVIQRNNQDNNTDNNPDDKQINDINNNQDGDSGSYSRENLLGHRIGNKYRKCISTRYTLCTVCYRYDDDLYDDDDLISFCSIL